MILYEEALSIIRQHGQGSLLGAENVPLAAIPGRICAADIRAARDNQPFDNSAMDGFALKAVELANAANDNPVILELAGHLAAGGEIAIAAPAKGQCYEIMTGAPIPPGCDAVVPVEKTEKDEKGRILFRGTAMKGDNIRRAATDFAIGDIVLKREVLLREEHVLALATLGIGEVQVVRKPKVAVLSTGLEVVDDFSANLKPGQIYNSTGPYLTAMFSGMDIEQVPMASISDDAQLFKSCLQGAVNSGCDIILSTGAVSAGVHDFVPAALKEVGAEILFHKVAIRPGKPVLFARLPDGGPFFFGLPGNPVSTAVGLRFFVTPLLRMMLGQPPETPSCAILAEDYNSHKSGLRFFLRGALVCDGGGVNRISIIARQQSFMVSPFVRSNSWVMIPEDAGQLKCGDAVQVYQ